MALISLSLLASVLIGAALTYWHAHKKVAVEMNAALSSAQISVTDAVEPLGRAAEPARQLQRIVSAFNGNRHLHAAWVGPTGIIVAESELAVPEQPTPLWFYQMFSGVPLRSDIALPRRMADLGYIRLSTDSHSEVGEVWEDISLKMLIVLLFTLLVLGLVSFSLSHALRPLLNLAGAFSRVGDGDYTASVPVAGPQEFARLYSAFNAMTSRLFEMETQNTRLNEQLATVQDEERADIARDLHDEFGPFLFSIDVDARSLRNKLTHCSAELASGADSIRASVAHLQKHLRSILGRLRPSALLDLGLKHALDHLVEFWRHRNPHVSITLQIEQTSYDAVVDNTCYRVVQEALNNAMKHGSPDTINIAVSHMPGWVCVRVFDNGNGMPDCPKHGFGLSGMRERLSSIGGSLRFGNRDYGLGFELEATIPLPDNADTSPPLIRRSQSSQVPDEAFDH